ncbi:MAG: DUF2088 domain-containing protein, partial [candidate division Zixibacteria bacterium]|nr:DUF2088 domain-containing protein [candidate division Zixibacteria bacterium]NIR47749.1 DUF2088 domain-containing protein [candidate division KSB1 bacterium]NIW43980.1 DUF2088 domain-containing protein [Gammaproteobacteria bacterium]NIR63055.1 DUF2088 domain-containing protein [candidate division Zixibacteria bacterium]NIS45067.1 DUF2088 domain-containing protein [candidate division Zixibacteria bacterium]
MLPDAINAFEEIKEFPLLQRVKLSFPRPQVTDIHSAVFQTIDALALPKANLKNKKVAITAGSRGISDIPAILASLVDYFHENEAFPFIVPSMGSHGGGTAGGQLNMLAKLGITEDKINAPILSSLETVELGQLPNGMPVYIDKLAAESDAIVVVNRVKPHTDFIGEIESGLAKMVSIGLGKLDGADTLHRYGVHGLHDLMPQAAQFICEHAPVLFGLAIVENAYHEIA